MFMVWESGIILYVVQVPIMCIQGGPGTTWRFTKGLKQPGGGAQLPGQGGDGEALVKPHRPHGSPSAPELHVSAQDRVLCFSALLSRLPS